MAMAMALKLIYGERNNRYKKLFITIATWSRELTQNEIHGWLGYSAL